jgi:hypothetical protein
MFLFVPTYWADADVCFISGLFLTTLRNRRRATQSTERDNLFFCRVVKETAAMGARVPFTVEVHLPPLKNDGPALNECQSYFSSGALVYSGKSGTRNPHISGGFNLAE